MYCFSHLPVMLSTTSPMFRLKKKKKKKHKSEWKKNPQVILETNSGNGSGKVWI